MSTMTPTVTAADLLARMPELDEDVAQAVSRAIDAEWDATRAATLLDDSEWGDDAEGRETEATDLAWSYAEHAGWELARAVAHVIEGAELTDVPRPTYADEQWYRAELADGTALVWWGESERVGDCAPAITWASRDADGCPVDDISGTTGWDLDPEAVAAEMLPVRTPEPATVIQHEAEWEEEDSGHTVGVRPLTVTLSNRGVVLHRDRGPLETLGGGDHFAGLIHLDGADEVLREHGWRRVTAWDDEHGLTHQAEVKRAA